MLLYVDDMFLIGKSPEKLDKLKQDLSNAFDIKDLGCAEGHWEY